jgi:hypothetical protein
VPATCSRALGPSSRRSTPSSDLRAGQPADTDGAEPRNDILAVVLRWKPSYAVDSAPKMRPVTLPRGGGGGGVGEGAARRESVARGTRR